MCQDSKSLRNSSLDLYLARHSLSSVTTCSAPSAMTGHELLGSQGVGGSVLRTFRAHTVKVCKHGEDVDLHLLDVPRPSHSNLFRRLQWASTSTHQHGFKLRAVATGISIVIVMIQIVFYEYSTSIFETLRASYVGQLSHLLFCGGPASRQPTQSCARRLVISAEELLEVSRENLHRHVCSDSLGACRNAAYSSPAHEPLPTFALSFLAQRHDVIQTVGNR